MSDTTQPADPEWSQARETALMVDLAAGQVEAAMKDSNASVEVLSDTFTTMASTLQMIQTALDTLPDTVGNGRVKGEIKDGARVIAEKVHQAIIAFQFYDKLVQRLAHVSSSLAELGALVGDPQRLDEPQSWLTLRGQVRAKYTMAEECAMFDAVVAGKSVQQALDEYMAARLKEAQDGGGDIELF